MTDPVIPPAGARALDRRRFLIGGAMIATAAVAAAREPRNTIDLLGKRKLDQLVPSRIGNWSYFSSSGLVVPPQDQLKDALYTQLLTRVYNAPDQPPMMLLIAQGGGQTGVIQIHRPEICYPVGGYSLSESGIRDVPLRRGELAATAFTATSDDRVEQLLYWTRVGYDLPQTWAQQRWAVAKANLQREIPDAVLVRISTISTDRAGSFALINDFARRLVDSLDPKARQFLVGPDLA